MSKLDYRRDGNRVVICAAVGEEEKCLAEVRDLEEAQPSVRFLGPRSTLAADTAKRVVDYVLTRPWRRSS